MKTKEIKHLEFIQNIITRMNSNSFQIKGLCITIVCALLAIYGSNSNKYFLILPILPTILFWFLDSYYLQQERKFRGLYNDIIDTSKSIISFKMSIQNYNKGMYTYCNVFVSKTIIFFIYQ